MSRGKPIRLPPLPALRAFEATARASSVRDAALELGLTPSAVSHQLRNLEDHLGIALFKRSNQSIELTSAGEELASYVERGFDELRQGVQALNTDPNRGVLNVSVTPMFAMEILLPALPDFERAYPDIRVRMDVGESLADLDSESVDLAIRIGAEPTSSLYYETLLEVCWAPVCAPSLMKGANRLSSPQDLSAHVLLMSSETEATQRWFAAAGIADIKPAREHRFDTFLGALQAAEGGLGVAIAPLSVVARHLKEERLVTPFDVVSPSPWPYRFVCRRGRERQPKVDRFRRWIKQVCERQSQLLNRRCGSSGLLAVS